jgi:hypothetical protein
VHNERLLFRDDAASVHSLFGGFFSSAQMIVKRTLHTSAKLFNGGRARLFSV